MKKYKSVLAIIMSFLFLISASFPGQSVAPVTRNTVVHNSAENKLDFTSSGLSQNALDIAINRYNESLAKNPFIKPILSIADFSQSSNNKRLYIIDLSSKKILLQTYVSHGRNSGEEFAKSFSNKAESYMSSPGFYITGDTYTGKHGLSLFLKGQDKGINDMAESRAIVVHGASYVSEDFIKKNGRLGRSQGCPAVSEELAPKIIETIKGGSALFIYVPDAAFASAR
jgi:hypothetical protein